MPGVKIGNGAVVVNDIEPYTIVGGNPARVIKRRFSKEVIDLLEEIEWWNWNVDKITENLEILVSNNLKELIRITL